LPPEKIVEVEDFDEFLWRRTVKPEQPVEKEERASELQAIAVSMKVSALTGNPPRFIREELPERRLHKCMAYQLPHSLK
jgi:hypothetical protein